MLLGNVVRSPRHERDRYATPHAFAYFVWQKGFRAEPLIRWAKIGEG